MPASALASCGTVAFFVATTLCGSASRRGALGAGSVGCRASRLTAGRRGAERVFDTGIRLDMPPVLYRCLSAADGRFAAARLEPVQQSSRAIMTSVHGARDANSNRLTGKEA